MVAADRLASPPLITHLTVQWHITDCCNLRCKHCYQDKYLNKGFELPTLRRIADQIFFLHEQQRQRTRRHLPLFINITGGEPCLHPDLISLIDYLKAHPADPHLGILTNGSLVDKKTAKLFSEAGVFFVQLSVEGEPATHDSIRGNGSFAGTVRASLALKKAGIRVVWSFTAHSGNYREFPLVAELAEQYGINRLWSDRMIPAGHDDAPLALNIAQTRDYLLGLGRAYRNSQKKRPSETIICLDRALQFQALGGTPYHCKAGCELVAIMPDGGLYPCRRLPVPIGNVLKTPLHKLYASELLNRLRLFQWPDACEGCLYKRTCRGGLRCLAHMLNGDMFSRDPGCDALPG